MRSILTTTITVLVLVTIWFIWAAVHFASKPASHDHSEVVFEVPEHAALHPLAVELEQKGLITSARKFVWYAKLAGDAARIKVGEYALYKDMKPSEILQVLTSGKSMSYALVVPEGSNIFDIRDSLNHLWPGRGDQFFKLATDPSVVREVTGANYNSMEGYLFPDTYSITKYTPVLTLIRHMYSRFEAAIKQVNTSEKVPMSVRDQVILASMIEKETGDPKERPLISSVFHNRLKKGMRLQSDPTIIYGMMLISGVRPTNIKKDDIHRPSQYNTYTIPALPSGPIGNPGMQSLWAAVNPADTRYLYFVSRNDGTHVFSENFRQHQLAVKKFQLNPMARVGKSWRDLIKKEHARTRPEKAD